jgi:hypothetical protein
MLPGRRHSIRPAWDSLRRIVLRPGVGTLRASEWQDDDLSAPIAHLTRAKAMHPAEGAQGEGPGQVITRAQIREDNPPLRRQFERGAHPKIQPDARGSIRMQLSSTLRLSTARGIAEAAFLKAQPGSPTPRDKAAGERLSAASEACSVATTCAPSPTAAATRFTEPERTSPMANTRLRLVSSAQ